MEDLGWYVVDNLPPSMLNGLYQLAIDNEISKLGVVLDVRSRAMFAQLPAVFAELEERGADIEILYLEAREDVIVKRQESSRRPLPLQGDVGLLEGVVKEKRMLSTLRAAADLVIDTTDLNVHQLARRVNHVYGGEDGENLKVLVMSFGFKNGIPIDSDLVFDVRFLPNPHWVDHLRPQTGLSEEVSNYVLSQDGAQPFLDQIEQLIKIMAAGYIHEGKRQVTVSIGCTGGKHRSTAMTERLAKMLNNAGIAATSMHRDLGKE